MYVLKIINMDSNKKTARIAGAVYLVLIVSGIFSLVYVPSQLIVGDDASATVANIIASELLFRLSIVSGLICFIAFLVLPLVLYELLKPINKTYALLMVVFAVVSVPISLVNMGNKLAVLSLVSEADYLRDFEASQVEAQVMLYLDLYGNGNLIAHLFWGLWLLPFGYLVFKSEFLPKILGRLLMVGCFGYLIDFLGYFLFPSYGDTIIPTLVGLPSSFGEIGICLWLLIAGIREKKPALQAI